MITKQLLPLLALGFLTVSCKPGGSNAYRYETAPVARGDLRAYVSATGTLSAVVSVDVGSQVSGRIVTLSKDYNSTVKMGELIAEIDPSIYRARVKEAEGDLASAKASVKLKQQNLARKQTLVPLKAATELDLEQGIAELAQSEASVMIKEANLDRARIDLGFCQINAPVDGIVISRQATIGQTLAAAMTTPVLYTIAQDLKRMHIVTSISEADIGQVKVGQSVEFSVDAYLGDLFTGTVTQVRMAPITKENVVTYETIITVENEDQKFFPGMTADVTILVAERQNVLTVPNTALRFTPPEGSLSGANAPLKLQRGEQLVYLPGTDGKSLQALPIRLGITDNTRSEILSGLDASDKVITSAASASEKSKGFPPDAGPPPI